MRTLAIMHLPTMGGPAQHVYPWLEPLATNGRVDVIVPGPGSAATLYGGLGTATVLEYEPLTFPRGPDELFGLVRRFVRDVGAFRRRLRRERPDLVVIVTAVLPADDRLRRRDLRQGLRPQPGPRSWRSVLIRTTRTLASAVVCCSEAVRRQFLPAHGTPVATVYPGVDGAQATGDRDGFRRQHRLEEAAPCLAVVGNVTPGRGQDIAIRALQRVRERFPEAGCLIAGEAHRRPRDLAFRDSLPRLAEELGVRDAVVFTGFVENVADVYAAADIVVNPARFNEPCAPASQSSRRALSRGAKDVPKHDR